MKYNLHNLTDCIFQRNDTFHNFLKPYQNLTDLPPKIQSKQFDWNEKDQGNILSSFFWLHWLTQIPGGLLATKYGTKKVYGITNFLGAVCCFAIPFCAYQSVFYLILIRAVQGLIGVSVFIHLSQE